MEGSKEERTDGIRLLQTPMLVNIKYLLKYLCSRIYECAEGLDDSPS